MSKRSGCSYKIRVGKTYLNLDSPKCAGPKNQLLLFQGPNNKLSIIRNIISELKIWTSYNNFNNAFIYYLKIYIVAENVYYNIFCFKKPTVPLRSIVPTRSVVLDSLKMMFHVSVSVPRFESNPVLCDYQRPFYPSIIV